MRGTARVAAVLAVSALALPACTPPPPSPSPSAPSSTPTTAATATDRPAPSTTTPPTGADLEPRVVGEIAAGLAAPWSVAFLPDGSALVSERDTARILRIPAGGGPAREVATVPGVDSTGEGGLLGLAVRPGTEPPQVYAMWSTPIDNRVGSMVWRNGRLTAPEVVFDAIPHSFIHNGGRLLFDGRDILFASTGDADNRDLAQDPGSLAGKILRMTPSGAVPGGNPDPGSAVWSLGHRNVQGLSLDESGRLWASEFGASDVDELNRIVRGGNYGWPVYEGRGGSADGYFDPAATWSPTSTASPSGMAIVGGSAWIAGLRGETLWQVPLTGNRAGEPIAWFIGEFGRLRDVVAAPGGSLWIVTNNTDGRGSPRDGDDRILRVRLY